MGKVLLILFLLGVLILLLFSAKLIKSPALADSPLGTLSIDDRISQTTSSGLNQFNYQGSGWNHWIGSSNLYQSTFSWDDTKNDFVTLNFYGTQVNYFAPKDTNSGIVAVSIDNGPEINIDLYSRVGQDDVNVWSSESLPLGDHIFKIRVTGLKNGASNDPAARLDKVDVVTPINSNPTPIPSSSDSKFVKVSGFNLIYNGQIINLRGENFNNETALGANISPTPNILEINTDESDYALLQSEGANLVRFGLSFNWYEDNRNLFFQIMDQQVAWAKAHHLWLIPVLFTTPDNCGLSYSNHCPNFWLNTSYQEALKNFWVDFATHYVNEPTIAGYDILNEPWPPSSQTDPWPPLFQSLHDALLSVDPNHFIVYESDTPQISQTFGPNTIYSLHGYIPLSLTYSITTGQYTYPGNAPDYNGIQRNWSKAAFAGQTGDPNTNLLNRLDVNWAKSKNVPLFIGEDGSKNYTNGYNQLVGDKLSLYNSWGVSWAEFVWRSPAHDFGLYPEKGVLNLSDQPLLSAVEVDWVEAVQPDTSYILEGENMKATYAGSIFSDPTASGGEALLIKNNDTASGVLTTKSNVSSISVSAEGDQCNGAPLMNVSVDGLTVLSTTVSATSWKNYSFSSNQTLSPGNHKIAVSYVNEYSNSTCNRNLKIDSITLK